MTGKRQHYLPRFLLKGFVSRVNKREKYTFVFSKQGQPYETNLINIGLENFFYGNPDNSETDDVITQEENKHIHFTEQLRQADKIAIVDPTKSSSFVAHLAVRIKHIRESMVEIQGTLFEALQNIVEKSTNSPKFFSDFIRANKEIFAENLRAELSKKLSPFETEIRIQKALNNIDSISSKIPSEVMSGMVDSIKKVREKTPDMIANAHNETLSKKITSNNFLEPTKGFKWHIVLYDNQNLVLGDVGPIGIALTKNKCEPILFEKNNISQVLLPISNTHLLIGTSQDCSHGIPNEKSVNEYTASLSRLFFISKRNTKTELDLSSLIGSQCSVIDEKEREMAITKLENDLLGKRKK